MNNLNVLEELRNRGFIAQISHQEDLEKILIHRKIKIYCGFDPTSDSLHIGHLLPLLCLLWFQKYNHSVIIIIGGATSLIGDPSFKKIERKLHSINKIFTWSNNIKRQILSFFQNNDVISPIILNNYDWFKNMNILSFLRDTGKFFLVNNMINKSFIKKRMNQVDQGISFTEFSYNLLQSYDFLEVYKNHQVILQIGGSDQWGNIISGIDLIRRIHHRRTFGLTIPLLKQENGIKFGKTEIGKIIWLDSNKTSPYVFYQFWLNIKDVEIIDFLKLFTFLKISEINNLQNMYDQKKFFYLKCILADNITNIVHGKKKLDSAKRITHSLFSENIFDLTELDFEQLKKDGMPSIVLNGSEDLKKILILSQYSRSRNQAHQLIISNAIRINYRIENSPNYVFTLKDKLFGKFTLLSKGKKNHILLCW